MGRSAENNQVRYRRARFNWFASLALILVGTSFSANATNAVAQDAPQWLTGRKLDQALALPVGLGWPDNPLGDSLKRLSQNQQVAVLLDRRVDPNRQVKLQVNRPLHEVFSSIAAEYNTQHTQPDVRPRPAERLAVTRIGDVILLGPATSNGFVRTVAENRKLDVDKLSTTRKVAWVRKRPLSWPAGSTPQQILKDWADESSLRITNLNQVPHDVWPAANLPSLNSIEALTLVLSNFDYTFEITGQGAQLQLVAISEDDCKVERTYSGGDNPQQLAADLSAAVPNAEITFRGTQLLINARVEEHEWISGARQPGDSPVAGTQVHSLKVEKQPVGRIIDYLAENLSFQVRWDDRAMTAAGISRDKLVSFEVVKQPLDKLLEAALDPAGLKHTREGDIVRITTK